MSAHDGGGAHGAGVRKPPGGKPGEVWRGFGTKLPIPEVCCLVAIEGKADVAQTAPFGSD
jgi:hypothetical protein